jgi:hypothetical protein
MIRDPLMARIAEFLDGIGLKVEIADGLLQTFLPGITTKKGILTIDDTGLLYRAICCMKRVIWQCFRRKTGSDPMEIWAMTAVWKCPRSHGPTPRQSISAFRRRLCFTNRDIAADLRRCLRILPPAALLASQYSNGRA